MECHQLTKSLFFAKKKLMQWNYKHFSYVHGKIAKLENELLKLQQSNKNNKAEARLIKKKLNV